MCLIVVQAFQESSNWKKRCNLINFMALVRERTIPTERPPLVDEVSATFCGYKVSRGQRNGSPRPYSRISRPGRRDVGSHNM
jgi:hypothetical protein